MFSTWREEMGGYAGSRVQKSDMSGIETTSPAAGSKCSAYPV